MPDKRKNERYRSLAKALIEGIPGGETFLKDISITGCCLECTVYPDIKPDVRFKIEILPETASKIGGFDLLAESKWVRMGDYSCEIGFAILESPKGKMFQRYVDYLVWRSSMDSGSSAV